LQHFRSYVDEAFEFSAGVNIIIGPNGSGKTNLLEALLMLAQGKTYRGNDLQVVGFNQPWSRLDTVANKQNRSVKLELEPNAQRVSKSFVIDEKPYRRLSLAQTIPIVLFEPNDLLFMAGAPDLRRSYLDELLERIQPGYGTLRRNYRRALAQRNALLKHGVVVAKDQVFVWNVRLSDAGARIAGARADLIERLGKKLQDIYNQLAQQDNAIDIHYTATFPLDVYGTRLLRQLEQYTERDCMRGFTADGPHREDLLITLNKQPFSVGASRGENRTMLLALKMLELEVVQEARQQPPVLLLDDVFSELDGARRRALTEYLEKYQTFITTTDADVVVQHFMDRCTILPLQKT
jgi:DNA replication and repair protein RecF